MQISRRLHETERFQKHTGHASARVTAEAERFPQNDLSLEFFALLQQSGSERKPSIFRTATPLVLHGSDSNFFDFKSNSSSPLCNPALEFGLDVGCDHVFAHKGNIGQRTG